eukprot:m.208592 g.208592  ORF g.208592 m.208592 type:complete len:124 (-) comp18538_c0_seq4:1757-2128(-)
MPLVLPPAAKLRTAYLMDVPADVDVRGDVGTIGRFSVGDVDEPTAITLDLKGMLYRGCLARCNTFLMVEMLSGSEKTAAQAKVTHKIDSFMCTERLDSSLYNETVLEVQQRGFARRSCLKRQR